MNESKAVFTICVPSFNRGNKALELVKEVLPALEVGWELMLIDNCSFNECAGYEEIAGIARGSSGGLIYRRNTCNVGFHGNYLNCLREPAGEIVMVLSDEDRPNIPIISKALAMIREHPGISVIRGSIAPQKPADPRKNSFQLKDDLYPAGKCALTSFALTNNYFSGTIYNRALLARHGIIERLEKNLSMHRDYPHLYLEGLACAVGDVALCAEISCYEGVPQMVADGANPYRYITPYSIGGRLDQFVVLRDCLREAVEMMSDPFDSELFGNLYLRHTAKFFHLIGRANAALYAKNGIDVGVAVRAFAYFACAAMIRLKECEQHRDFMMEEIERLARQFGG